MSSGSLLYFVNSYEDYSGKEIQVNTPKWKTTLECILQQITQRTNILSSECEGGLYVGLGGIGYMFIHLASSNLFSGRRNDFLARAEEYFNCHFQYLKQPGVRDNPAMKASFLFGNAGIYAIGVVLAHKKGVVTDLLNQYIDSGHTCKPLDFLQCGGDELFVGRAGFLCSALWLEEQLGYQPVPKDLLYHIWNMTIHSGRQNSKQLQIRFPPLVYRYYDTNYFGAAHGLSSILQMLLSFPEFLARDSTAELDIRTAVDYLLTLQQDNGNFQCDMTELRFPRAEKDELVHWCHGAPGTVYMFAKAYLHWKDPKYLQACLKCGDVTWQKGLLKKGPGICHGVAGNGYVFLLLYRLTRDPCHLYRALKFAEYLETEEFKTARTPDCPYSLYEGWAGTACFLSDLLNPDNATFPFFNVFFNSQ